MESRNFRGRYFRQVLRCCAEDITKRIKKASLHPVLCVLCVILQNLAVPLGLQTPKNLYPNKNLMTVFNLKTFREDSGFVSGLRRTSKWLTFTWLARSDPGTAVQAKWKSEIAYSGFVSGLRRTSKWLTFTWLARSDPGTAVQAKWKSEIAYSGFVSGLRRTSKWLTFTWLARSDPGTAVQAKWKSEIAYSGFVSGLTHELHLVFEKTRISENHLQFFVWFWVASQVVVFHLACTPVPRYDCTFTWASQVTRHWPP